MNRSISSLLTAALCCASFSHSFAYEQTASLAPVAVTFALTKKQSYGALYPRLDDGTEDKTGELTDWVDYTVDKGTSSTYTALTSIKAATYKVANVDVLNYLVEVGSIDSTTGWSIMALPTVDLEAGSISYDVYAAKSGEDNVDLFTVTVENELTATGSYVETLDSEGNVTSARLSGSATYESATSVSVFDQELSGLFTSSIKVSTYLPETTERTALSAVGVPALTKISNILGSDEDGNPYGGSISFAASRMVVTKVQ
jgi:hypothetical protein